MAQLLGGVDGILVGEREARRGLARGVDRLLVLGRALAAEEDDAGAGG